MSAQPTAADVPMLRIPRSAHPTPTTPRVRSVRLPWWGLALAVVVLAIGLFVAAEALGWVQTTGKGTGTEERVGPTGNDPAEIKGWMTMQQVLDAYPAISREKLYDAFGIPAGTPTDLGIGTYREEYDGVTLEVPALRTWITEQLGAAATP